MRDWTFWGWVLGLLGKRCPAYLDTSPHRVKCQRRFGHINKHRDGDLTFIVGTRGD